MTDDRSTLKTESFRSATILRFALIGAAVIMLSLYALHRYSSINNRQALLSQLPEHSGSRRESPLTPWEYMARMEGQAFLVRNLGNLRYPGGVIVENPPHTIELYVSVKDRPEVVAEYYAKQCRVRMTKSKVAGMVRYSSLIKLNGSSLLITVTPDAEGAIIKFSLPDMHPPTLG